jgi:hypothetical protein
LVSPPAGAAVPFDLKAITLPEGMTLDEAESASFSSWAGEHKISPEAATKLFELYGARMTAQTEANTTANDAANSKLWNDTQSEWQAATIAELGDTKDAVLTRVTGLLTEFGDDNVRQAMDLTGAGNHVAVIRFLDKLALAVGEGTPVNPAGRSEETNPLDALYPSMKNK